MLKHLFLFDENGACDRGNEPLRVKSLRTGWFYIRYFRGAHPVLTVQECTVTAWQLGLWRAALFLSCTVPVVECRGETQVARPRVPACRDLLCL